jgi:Protein of unknown function (DUF499)
MSTLLPKSWLEVVALHPDVLAENFSEDIFALDLGPLADKLTSVPAVYRDPEHFFKTSYLTAGLKSLLNDVLLRLSGGEGSRVLKLMTPFGGGKSHTLAALWHAAKNRAALDIIPEAAGLPRPSKPVNVAVFDGAFFDALKGKSASKSKMHANTMWGWLAWSLHGEQGYERFKEHDQKRIAPGGDEILGLLESGPNLILLDEVLQYLISVGGLKIEQTTLRDETLTFLQRLTMTVTNTNDTALVFTLQSSKRESLDYVNLLQTVDHLAARKDQRREPVEGAEIPRVIQRRLLAKVPSATDAAPAAQAYQDIITQMRRAHAQTAAEKQQAEEEGIGLRDRIRSAYPFHPALVDLMRERWAAIPDFQRTRGALRFLAACLRATHKAARSRALLGPGDVPIQDAEVRQAFFKEVGQQSDFQAVLEHDFIGANARARRIDERRVKEVPSETGRHAAIRLATAILMYSFGGLRRDGGGESEFLPPGITETELLAACVGPDLDSTTALACLKELREQCLYLHFDGARYTFKKDPNVTLLVEQEADMVARDEKLVRDRIKEMLEERLAGRSSAIVWPEKPGEIPDKQPLFQIAYLPLEFAGKAKAEQESAVRELFEKYGDKPRLFKNGIGVAVPTADQVEGLRRAVRYILSAERVSQKATQLNLTQDQKSQLRERTNTEAGAAEAALLRLYAEVWLPKAEQGGLTIEKIAAGGRPLQVTLNQKKQAAIHERVQELITTVQPRVFATLHPHRIVELFALGTAAGQTPGRSVTEIVEGFFSFPNFTRLADSAAVRKSVVRGVKEKFFGYVAGATPPLGADGRYQVAAKNVRFDIEIADDEVDLDGGFVMIPETIPQPSPVSPSGTPSAPHSPAPGAATSGGGQFQEPTPPQSPGGAPAPSQFKAVEFSFAADRNKLYAAWQALANLADLCGNVTVSVKGEPPQNIDKSKLENGVFEPLREANLID